MARTEEYQKMFKSVSKHGLRLKTPSYHEIRVKYLDYYEKNIHEDFEVHRIVWKKLGCTIMTDGWSDRIRTILNFLVNSPKGAIF